MLAFLGALLILASQIARIPALLVDDVSVIGVGAVPKQEVRNIVASVTGGSYALIAPKTNALVYPRGTLRDELLRVFPRIASVSVDTPHSNEARITITERAPAGVWCGAERTEGPEGCFFLDKTGFIYSRAPQFTNSPFFMYYGARSNEDVEPIGTFFLSQNVLQEFNLFVEGLSKLGMTPRALVEHDDYFELIDEGGTRIFFPIAEGYAGTLENIRAILGSGEFQNDIGGKLLSVDYIDLRFGSKVFYKLEN